MATVRSEDLGESMSTNQRQKWEEDFAACAQAYVDTFSVEDLQNILRNGVIPDPIGDPEE